MLPHKHIKKTAFYIQIGTESFMIEWLENRVYYGI